MKTYLLDSDILIDFFKKKQKIVELIVKLAEEEALAASVLSVAELRAGWTDKEARFFLPRFYSLVAIQEITPKIAELAGKFRRDYKTRGHILSLIDTLIAATAIMNDAYLITRNVKDFPMPNIKLLEE